eukprot:2197850-Alexandrium_andersonii.AAC.1
MGARRLRRRAPGLDGIAHPHLRDLSREAWEALAHVLNEVERVGTWPTQWLEWRVSYLPNAQGVSAEPTPVAKLRPIA